MKLVHKNNAALNKCIQVLTATKNNGNFSHVMFCYKLIPELLM
jgi:hypothetical protein